MGLKKMNDFKHFKWIIPFIVSLVVFPIYLEQIEDIESKKIILEVKDSIISLLPLMIFGGLFILIVGKILLGDEKELDLTDKYIGELKEELYETVVVKSFCPNCHAPFEGLSKCAYCGYSFIKKVKK